MRVQARSAGWQGYESSAEIGLLDMTVGLMAWGGERQKGWKYVGLPGRGCEWIDDWDLAQESLEGLPQYEHRRVDIALDTFQREVTHQSVIDAYRAGLFITSGRPPKFTRIESERPEDGRTCYIGSRERDKFLRGYEKGLEMAQGTTLTHIDGVPIQDIYRLELELKAKTSALPVDLIDNRDQYFAGAYPYLQSVLADVQPEILVMRRERGPQLDLARALAVIRRQYGNTLFTAAVAHHGDFGAVWSKVVGNKHSEALLRAGVLLVDHE
jgi:phage replication initiation protein